MRVALMLFSFGVYSSYAVFDYLYVHNLPLNFALLVCVLVLEVAGLYLAHAEIAKLARSLGHVELVGILLYFCALGVVSIVASDSSLRLFAFFQVFAIGVSGICMKARYRHTAEVVSLIPSSVYITAFILMSNTIFAGEILLFFYGTWLFLLTVIYNPGGGL